MKIGHGGTLDPLATGILIMGLGSATKSLPQFLQCRKTYETVVLFGASTDTYDRVGRVLTQKGYDHITEEKVEAALGKFRGKQKQIPPLYSALKMNGKPLYEYAREGKPIPREIEAKEVEVFDMELVEYYKPGEHNHRWPTEEAEAAERNLAEQVWRVKKMQETGKPLTDEEKAEDNEAMAAHESFKKRFEERSDNLVRDSPPGKSREKFSREEHGSRHMMSGALGQLPDPVYSAKGTNLVPAPPSKDEPPPWKGEGPAAVKIRLTVSSGYYVRSFCHDLGAELGSAALMAELCRTQQSDFEVGGINTLEPEELEKGEEVWGPRIADMLARWNGEPEGNWAKAQEKAKGKQTGGEKTPEKREDRAKSPSQSHKRKRSRSPTEPRQAMKRSNREGSWNGISD